MGCVITPKSRPCTCQLGLTPFLQTRSYDEKCQFGLTCFFFSKRVKPSWYFLVIWPHRESKCDIFVFFFIQSVITKVEIIPFSMGILFILFEPFVEEKNDGPSSNREATIFFCVILDSKPSWQQYCFLHHGDTKQSRTFFFTLITKIEIIPFFHGGFSIYRLILLLTKGKEWAIL